MKVRIFYHCFTMALALVFSLAAVSAQADNTVLSSTMIFQGTLSPQGGGVYHGTLNMVDEAAMSLGDNISGYDVYARNGATAWFGNDPGGGPVWTSQAIGTSPANHDGWPTWNPDTPDWYQYSLNLYVAGGVQKWAVRNHPGSTVGNPHSTPANGVPMSGVMDWSNMYAEETDVGAYIGGGSAEIPGGAATHGGGAHCWDMDWSWGSEVVPLDLAGFDVVVSDLGGGQYRVTMTPSDCWLGGTGTEEIEYESISGSGTMQDTPTGGDVAIDATGDHTVTVAKYAGNPGSTGFNGATGNYWDVHLSDDTGVTSVTIEFCPGGTSINYWNGSSWEPCSNQSSSGGGCITVTINASTHPGLSDLSGLPFGSMGTVGQSDRVGILDPWFAPLAALMAVAIASIVFIRRRSA